MVAETLQHVETKEGLEYEACRAQWLVHQPVGNFMIRFRIFLGKNVRKSLEWLGLREGEFRITRTAPAGSGSEKSPFPGTKLLYVDAKAEAEPIAP